MTRRMTPWIGALLIAVFMTAPTGAASPAAETAGTVPLGFGSADKYAPWEILVGFQAGAPATFAAEARKALGAGLVEAFPEIGVQRWKLPSHVSVPEAIQRLAGNPHIRYSEPNYLLHALEIPNDPLRNELWGLHNLGQTGGTQDADIDVLEAWQAQTGSASVVVGIIDTGIDYNHEDLVGNIWTNPGEDLNANGVVDAADFNGLDDDGNGKVDDLRGWDCRNGDNDPMDDHNHGTHVAGTVGARGNNGVGVVGVNWNVKLMPLKFLSSGGSGSTTDAIECINYAASFVDANGNKIVRITSNSWGGGQKSRALEQAIAASGALFVAAAGNSGSSSKMYPAGYSLDNIISVAATDQNDLLASFSNFGSDWVDLGAPGVDVLSATRNNMYRPLSGTSMATPHVSGVAALLMAQFPLMTNAEVKAKILDSVDSLPSLQGKTVTGGRLNAARALGAQPDPADATPPAAVTDLAVDPVGVTPTSLTLNWTATGDDASVGTAYLYDVRYGMEPITDANWDVASKASGEPIPRPSGASESFTVAGLSPGTMYYLALRVADEAGGLSDLSNLASGTTASTGWETQVVDGQAGGSMHALVYDPSGQPAIAYGDDVNNVVRFARWNGLSWDIETVDAGAGTAGIDLAYDPSDGNPSVSYGNGAFGRNGYLKFAHRQGPSWTIQLVDGKGAYTDWTSLAYDPRDRFPSISYVSVSKNDEGTLKLAHWDGTSWSLQIVEVGARARYSSLAFDPAGNPSIAYSDDVNRDRIFETLKLARWNGLSWEIQIVETGVNGYGISPDLAFDPVTAYPAIVHNPSGQVRLARWNGASWDVQVVASGNGGSLAFNATGALYVAYGASTEIHVARWDGTAWQVQLGDVGFSLSRRTVLVFDPSGTPSLSYSGTSTDGSVHGVKFARRATIWASGSTGGSSASP